MVSLVFSLLLCAAPLTFEPPALAALREKAPLTVVEFFSSQCACQRAHDERLNALAGEFMPSGVQFVAVDSEASATVDADARERAARGYAFALITDAQGQWAEALSARFATFVVVLDRAGRVLYRGGLDSDRQYLTADASLFLRDTLLALTHGKHAPRSETSALGCSLRRQ